MKTEIIQKLIVLNQEDKMLLLRRSATDTRRPLQWDLPGGALDDGETLEDGVRREALEEAGLKINALKLVFTQNDVVHWTDNDKKLQTNNVVWLYYASLVGDSEVTLSFEHDQSVWVTFSEALNMMQYPRHLQLIRHIVDNNIHLS